MIDKALFLVYNIIVVMSEDITGYMQTYRSGHNGADSKFLEAPVVSSAEEVRRTRLCAGSDFTISYRSCVFFLHSSGARITLEIYGELSERSKVRHSKSCD